MAEKIFLSRFSPGRTKPEFLEKIFVQREALLKDAEERIHESAVSGNKHHLLLIGPRGSGKTHFVALMFHRLDGRDDLRDRLRIAWLAEDETTTSFLKLLLRIYRALGERYPDEFPAEALEPLYGADDAVRVKLLSRLLTEKLARQTLLVIVENLDELFKGLGDQGQQEWRAFLQENPVSATLATSQQLFDGVSRRDSPFYGHFQIEYLKPLTLEEAVLLLRKVADLNGDPKLSNFLQTATGRSRVRALHHLSGGNHRIYIVLSDFINAESLDELIGPFEKMLDELTPYYQARLGWLSPQQREIVEYLCGCSQPVPVKDIARTLFISHQTATGQLKELREKGYVTGHAWGRESRYELSEPLMRLCVEVKENRRQPMRLIVDFLRIWYSREQLQVRLRSLTAESVTERVYVAETIRYIESRSDDPRIQAVLADLERARQAPERDEVVRLLEELAETRGQADDWISLGDELGATHGRYEEALAACDKALALKPDAAHAWKSRTFALVSLGRHEEALAASDKALALNPDYANAWIARGFALYALGRHEEALAAYDKALALNPDYANAGGARGMALRALGRHEEALAAFDKALALNPDYANAWNNRGNALRDLGRHEEALAAFDKVLALNPDDADAWCNRGVALYNLGRHEEALAASDKALALMPDDAPAWITRGGALVSLGRHEEALAAFDKALALMPDLVPGWIIRGAALVSLGRHEEGLAAFDKALALNSDDATAWKNRGIALASLDRYEEALAAFDKALALNSDDATAWNNRGATLVSLGRHEEALAALDKVLALKPDVATAWHNRVEPILSLNRWEEGFASLQDCLRRFPPATSRIAGDTRALVGIVLVSTLDQETWRSRVTRLVQIYAKGGALAYLGDGLIRSLALPGVRMLNAEALAAWRDVWFEAGAGHDELRIPLRIFDVGIRYLQTSDRRVLLDLLSEERQVLAEVFGLEQPPE